MSIYVGLDCGGSSSRVIAADTVGNILFQGQSGAANIASTPESRIRRNLSNATNGCPTPNFVCAGFAGLINDSTREKAIEILSEIFPNSQLKVEPDYTAAFFACPAGTDICVIAGTGSLVCSIQSGQMKKSGGGGYLLGDEGSAFQYGRDALRFYLQHPTQSSEGLRSAVLAQFGTHIAGDIVAQVYRAPTPAGMMAKLAKPFVADLRDGFSYAIESAEIHTLELAKTTARHIERHCETNEEIKICLAGGAWKGSQEIRSAYERHLDTLLPDRKLTMTKIERPPLHGALTLAFLMDQRN